MDSQRKVLWKTKPGPPSSADLRLVRAAMCRIMMVTFGMAGGFGGGHLPIPGHFRGMSKEREMKLSWVRGIIALSWVVLGFAGVVEAADLSQVKGADASNEGVVVAEGQAIVGPQEAGEATSAGTCDVAIYANDNALTSYYSTTPGIEIMDFGTSSGGRICEFAFSYATNQVDPGDLTVRFYAGTSSSTCPGTFLAGWNLSGLPGSPDGNAYIFDVAFSIVEAERFDLPAGAFGYSFQPTTSGTGPVLASGGSGVQDLFYKDCSPAWFGGTPFAAFTMTLTGEDQTPPQISVAPSSLSFDCAGAESADVTALAASPVDATPIDGISTKLVEPETILSRFESGATNVQVIVNLAANRELIAGTDFDEAVSRGLLQAEVARVQKKVLTRYEKAELTVRRRFENQAGFSAAVSQDVLEQLLADDDVASIEPVRWLEPNLAQGVPLMNATAARLDYNGAGLSVAICDTGVDYTHPRLGGGGFPNSKVIGGYDFGDDDADPMPCEPHGTACAGIAAGDLGTVGDYIGGVAYNAKVYGLKMSAACGGSAGSDAMIASWDWCVSHKNDDPANPIMVISTSFGGGQYTTTCDTVSAGMTTAAANAKAAGITVLASSGNDGYCDAMGWPACISDVISVGAVFDDALGTLGFCVNEDSCVTKSSDAACTPDYLAWQASGADVVTAYSNTAGFLDVLAPSHNAYTADLAGSSGYSSGDYTSNFGGTSAACPYAAGAVAALQQAAMDLQGTYLTPDEVLSVLSGTGQPIVDPKTSASTPRIDLGAAIASLDPCEGQFVTIENLGAQDLVITSMTKPAELTLTPGPPYTIPGGSSLVLCVEMDCAICDGADVVTSWTISSNDPVTPSVVVPINVDCPEAVAPVMTAASSIKTHGTVGDFAIPLFPAAGAVVECRQQGPNWIEVQFDQDIQLLYGDPTLNVTLSSGTVTSTTDMGSGTLWITLNGAADNQDLALAFPGVASAASAAALNTDLLCFGVLLGDCQTDRLTNVFDLLSVRNNLANAVSGSTFRCDVVPNGTFDIFDLLSVRNNLSKTIPPTCP